MKVHTIQRRTGRLAIRMIAICGAVLVGVASSQAPAQSALMNYLSSNNQAAGPRQMNHNGQSYRVVEAGLVKTAADTTPRGPISAALAGQGPIQQVSCNSGACSTGSCQGGGACNGACGGAGGSYSPYAMGGYAGGMACGPRCDPYCYGYIEALYLQRSGDRGFTFTGQAGRLEQFDFEGGARFTIGSVPDCVHGCEFSIAGVQDWERAGRQVDPNGGLFTFLSTGGFLDVEALRPFNDQSVDQRTLWEAEYWSLEGSKTLVSWEVAKLLYGFRYLEYNERFNFSSLNLAGEAGRFFSETRNRLAGLQLGADLLYPMGRFTYTDFRSRAGVYANFAEGGVQLVNSFQGNVIANFDEKTDLAGVLEMSGGVRFQLGDALAIRGGMEFVYITGLAKAPSQIGGIITPFTGRSVILKDDVFLYGLSIGGELRL